MRENFFMKNYRIYSALLQPQTDKNRKKAAQLPGSYTAEHTRVKTPENTGICWTFGAMASLESVMMTAGTAFSLLRRKKNRRGFSSIGENRAGIEIWLGTYKPSG